MFRFSHILSDLQAAIAVHAARNRALSVLLVALWGRIARIRTRLERLVALWRAGQLPKARAPRVRGAAVAGSETKKQSFPRARGWLTGKLGYEVAAFGGQLRHLLTDAECVAFLEAVPQVGRILRPLLRMLSIDPLPEIIQPVKRVVPEAVSAPEMAGIVVLPGFQFSSA
jgi:hypothetical protein